MANIWTGSNRVCQRHTDCTRVVRGTPLEQVVVGSIKMDLLLLKRPIFLLPFMNCSFLIWGSFQLTNWGRSCESVLASSWPGHTHCPAPCDAGDAIEVTTAVALVVKSHTSDVRVRHHFKNDVLKIIFFEYFSQIFRPWKYSGWPNTELVRYSNS